MVYSVDMRNDDESTISVLMHLFLIVPSFITFLYHLGSVGFLMAVLYGVAAYVVCRVGLIIFCVVCITIAAILS